MSSKQPDHPEVLVLASPGLTKLVYAKLGYGEQPKLPALDSLDDLLSLVFPAKPERIAFAADLFSWRRYDAVFIQHLWATAASADGQRRMTPAALYLLDLDASQLGNMSTSRFVMVTDDSGMSSLSGIGALRDVAKMVDPTAMEAEELRDVVAQARGRYASTRGAS